MTGQRRILSCELVAWRQYLDGLCLIKYEMDISQLWILDSLGIQDPSEQKTKEELHKASMEHFLRTVKVDEEEQFVSSLPWLYNHLSLPDNFILAFKWLQVRTHKLKKENLFKEYGDLFKEWKRESIIEEVPKGKLRSVSHYLPHRHVVKPDSTTKIRPVFKDSRYGKHLPEIEFEILIFLKSPN
ncbi:uncharacterized protein TNCV_2579911 [Trichonephila clavipes]|uniref:Uncharacterized protein n=1 Tax=Trichonephila clavipes TaxID=2585209 RepID=A0A8X6VHX9_TRICX|nr:uncharacterized protein TNCV_2579911 [Trichonephila clavipes]